MFIILSPCNFTGRQYKILTMKILQVRFLIFFLVMLIVPAAVSYLGGWDRNVDYLFVLKAFSIAFFMTVLYYLMVKNYNEKKIN